jgi:hypothetical protein
MKNKLYYIVMPPGWASAGSAKTALAAKRDFWR